jgi:hypothetical protein
MPTSSFVSLYGNRRRRSSNPLLFMRNETTKTFSPCSPIPRHQTSLSTHQCQQTEPCAYLLRIFEKQGCLQANPPWSQGLSPRPNQLSMAPRDRGQTENKGSPTQEAISPLPSLGQSLPACKRVMQELMVGGSYLPEYLSSSQYHEDRVIKINYLFLFRMVALL